MRKLQSILIMLSVLTLSSCHIESKRENAKGVNMMLQGDYMGAAATFGSVCQADPAWLPAFYNRGVAIAHCGDYEAALKDFNYVLAASPDHADSYFNRAILYENLKEYQNAIKDYTQALAIQPNFLMAYHYRGMVRFKMEDMYGALSDFTKALDLGRGVSMEIKQAKEFGLNSSGLFFCRAAVYHRLGEYDKAISDYSQSLLIDPSNAKAYFNRGAAYIKIGEYDKAKTDMLRAAELSKSALSD